MKCNYVFIEKIMRWVFIALTVLAIAYNFYFRSWEIFWSAVMTLILFLLPSFFTKNNIIRIPTAFQIIITLFIFASMYLGEVQHFFYKYSWWDRMLHSSSAIILAYIGYLLVFTLNRDSRMHVRLSPFFMSLFSFCFAVSMGVLWEIFEYTVDSLLGVNMQKARGLETVRGIFDTRLGVLDTMQDLIVDTLGALFVSVVGYIHLKRKATDDSRFWYLNRRFIEENPDLFNE